MGFWQAKKLHFLRYIIIKSSTIRNREIKVFFHLVNNSNMPKSSNVKNDNTDFTLCPIPIINCPFFLISLTNSIAVLPASNASENCLAAASKAPPNLSPWNLYEEAIWNYIPPVMPLAEYTIKPKIPWEWSCVNCVFQEHDWMTFYKEAGYVPCVIKLHNS